MEDVAERLLRWFTLNVAFAFTPLALVLVFRYLIGKLSFLDIENNILEILFFTIMLSVSTLSDIEERGGLNTKGIIVSLIKWFFRISSYLICTIYGATLLNSIHDLQIEGFKSRMLYIAISYAILTFIIGFIVQLNIALSNRVPVSQSPSTNIMQKGDSN